MDRKKFLIGACSLLILIGLFGAASPFVSSLTPSAKALADLPRIDISNIEPGTMVLPSSYKYEVGSRYKYRILIYRNLAGEFKFWNVITKNGHVMMPDLKWWRPFYECKSFGPTKVGGSVDESQPIKCHDAGIEKYWAAQWQWDTNGKNLGNEVADMQTQQGTIEGNYFVLGKKSS